MLAWVSYPLKLIGDVVRDDAWRAIGGFLLTVLGMVGLVSALDNSFKTFEQPPEFGIGAMFVACMILMTTDPMDYTAEQVRKPRDVWHASVRKVLGGGLIFCTVAIITGIAASTYFPISSETFGLVLGGCVLGCIAYGAAVLIARRIRMKRY